MLARHADFQLGCATIRPSLRTVEGPQGQVTTEPRVMQVLVVLADARGTVLTRDDLMRLCWAGTIVGDDAITRAIAEIRRVARQTAAGFGIETIPRVGYRLTEDERPAVGSPDPDVEAVVAPAATTRRWVLGGALAATGAAVAIALWRRSGSRTGQHVAQLIGKGQVALRMELDDSLREAVGLFESAVGIEPANATAWGLLALAQAHAAESGVDGAIDRCNEALGKAQDIDHHEPHAAVARALVRRGQDDWFETDRQLREVLQRHPDHIPALDGLSLQLQAAGYIAESRELNNRIVELDSAANQSWPGICVRKAIKHWIDGEDPEALEAAQDARKRWQSHPYVWRIQLMLNAFIGEFGRARSMLDAALTGNQLTSAGVDTWRLALAALESRSDADIDAAQEGLPHGAIAPLFTIMILSELRRLDAAYRVFDRMFQLEADQVVPAVPEIRSAHNPQWRQTQWVFTPAMRPFRAEARFRDRTRKMLLDAYWDRRGEPDEGRVYTGPLALS